MRTFLEVIEQRKTDKIAYECFSLMAERGIDPMKYVLWLQETDGLSNPNIIRESREWLDIEIDQINESQIGHNVGWALGKTPGWIAKGLGGVAGEVGSWFQGAGQGLGSDIDKVKGRGGIQGSPTSPTGFYDTETGHYVKWAGEGDPDPAKKDQWKTVNYKGDEIPPSSPPPQQGGNQPGQPGQQGGQQQGGGLWDKFTGMFSGGQGGQQGGQGQPGQSDPGHPPGSPQAMAQNAVKALQDLSKRANRRGSKLQQSGIQQMLFDIIQKLQDPNLFAAQNGPPPVPNNAPTNGTPTPANNTPTPAPTPANNTPTPAPTNNGAPVQTAWTDYGFGGTLRKKLVEVRLKNLADNLAASGIDPELFVEWYIDEGMHHQSIEEFNEDFGQWAHGLWGGIKGLFNKKTFSGGWAEVDDDYDRKSAEAALQSIQPLVGKHPQLDQQLQALNKSLREFLWDKAAEQPGQQPGQQPPNNAPGTTPQDQGDQGGQGDNDPQTQKDTADAAQAATQAGLNPQDPEALAQGALKKLENAKHADAQRVRDALASDPNMKQKVIEAIMKRKKVNWPKIAQELGLSAPQEVQPNDGSGPVTGEQPNDGSGAGDQDQSDSSNWVDPQDVVNAKSMLGNKKNKGEQLTPFEQEVDTIMSSGDDEKTQHEKIAAALVKHGHVKGQATPQAVQNAWHKFVGDLINEHNFYNSIYGSKKKATWFN